MEPGTLATVAAGLCFVAAGVYAYHYLGRTLEASREASAVVVEVVYESPTMQKGRMHPVVRFTTAEGRQVQGRSDKHYNTEPGARLQIVYDVRNPGRIEVGTLAQARRQRLFFSGAAVLLGLALGAGAIVVNLRRREPSPEAATGSNR